MKKLDIELDLLIMLCTSVVLAAIVMGILYFA
jgi:hypothetical protein